MINGLEKYHKVGIIIYWKFRGPSGPQLLVCGPLGLLDFVLRALRALRPCDPRNVALDSGKPNQPKNLHVSMMPVSTMRVSTMHVSTMHVSTMHVSTMHVSTMHVSTMHESTMHVSMMHVSLMYVSMIHVSMMHVSLILIHACIYCIY